MCLYVLSKYALPPQNGHFSNPDVCVLQSGQFLQSNSMRLASKPSLRHKSMP